MADVVGSTSIPGLAAKPVIDIDLTVSALERVHEEYVSTITEGTRYYDLCARSSIGGRDS